MVSVPYTCGELVQGLWEGMPALVSCPIDRYAAVTICGGKTDGWQIQGDFPKARAALQMARENLPQAGRGLLELDSCAPRGRGYGTSTADIASCLYAIGCDTATTAEIAIRIEPSDSTIFPGLTLFDHRQGAFTQTWGSAPPLNVILLDPGGQVDTIQFNQLDHQENLKKQSSTHQEAFNLLKTSLEIEDWQMFGEAASLSARAHQEILENQLLEKSFSLAKQVGALGVCRAHSGTILGLIIDPIEINMTEVAAYISEQLPESVNTTCHRMTNGGPKYQINDLGEQHVIARTYLENPAIR